MNTNSSRFSAAVAAAIAPPCDEGDAPQGNVIWFS
jgi:hypothetical protein